MTNDTYKTGYRHPPLANQFEKGKSGNPAGRPKGARNISSTIAAALAERVVVNIGGRRKSITKLEAAVTQLANKAAGGDPKATKLMMDLLHQSEARDEARAAGAPVSADERRQSDAAILAAVAASALQTVREGGHDKAG